MNWFGHVAFSHQEEVEPGVWEETEPIIKPYYGDLSRDSKRDTTKGINADITLVNILSIVADPYLSTNFHKILYVTYQGAKWRISSVESQYPNLILHFGELYKEGSYEG
jgi:hypothetical protein